MAGRPKDPNSLRALAARFSLELNRVISSKALRILRDKGCPMEAKEIERRFLNQERAPKKTGKPADPVEPESADDLEGDETDSSYLDIEKELKTLQKRLLAANDYENARTIRMQIAGIRDILKSLREQGYYVTKESQIRDGLATGQTIKSFVLKIPAELPQMIIGLDYADTVQVCEDYAYAILTGLAESEEGKGE